ncbi:MFS transporter [Anaeroselena agilis]|uniref:MFS transporter n=1 Tax=Anaeroselena agilis TaxID=3063788 RepID=A0ABU3NWD1_9FIRM|nr:MFS transporter [Selenomonadales bacterium 4137-cl]
MLDRSLYSRPFLSLVAANGFFWMSVNFFLPVLPIYYHSLGMNDHQIGLAVGAFSLGSLLFRLFSGRAVDRYGGLPVMTAGVILSVAAIGSYHLAVTLAAATVARFLHGVGISGYSASALTTVTMMHEERRAAEAVAFYTLSTMIGMGIAASSANWLYAAGGMPLVIGAGALATSLSLVLFPRRVKARATAAAGQPLPLIKVVTIPSVLISTVSLTAVNICYASIMTFLPLLMLSRGITEFNSYYVAYSVAVVLSRMWIGRLCAVLRPDRLAFYVLAILGLTMLAAGNFTGSWVAALCGAGIGIGYGLAFPAMATIITANVQPANRGTAFGFYTMAVDMGFGIGAIGMGAVAEAWGYQAVFAAAGTYTLAYAVLYQLWLRRKLAVPAASA